MNSVYVLYTHFTKQLPEALFEEYLGHLPKTLQETNGRYVRWQDRTANLLGKVLLRYGLKLVGQDFSLRDLKYNPFNKPFLNEEIDFSISHSGEYVVCALGIRQKVGVDIEEIKRIQLDDFKQFFTQEQFESILYASDPHMEFYKLWTIKESVVKADGRGLSFPLLNIRIRGDKALLPDKEWHLQKLDIADNYSAYLAYDRDGTTFLERELYCERIDF